MADLINGIFKNRKLNLNQLRPFGFESKGSYYVYSKELSDSGFRVTIKITVEGEVSSQIIDPFDNEPYILHLLGGARGSFAGKVRSQYEAILLEIADYCFEPEAFKSKQARELMAYVRDTYGDELEFLWPKFPHNAVWRRADTQKWYGVLLTVAKSKLGLDSDEMVEIIDFRMQPEELKALVDNQSFFLGYHMNKKHWCTIILDNSVPLPEIWARIDQSYLLAKK